MRAQEDLRAERENNELEIRRLLQAVDAAALRAEALRKAVAAGEVALTGATRAQEGGLLTQFDVLEARRNLFASRRDLAQAHYDHLTAQMRLMLVAGEPMQVIVQRIDAALTSRLPLAAVEAAQKR
jgi:outer membrane protein TolC